MSYVPSDAAAADLRGIVRYTYQQWGKSQVVRYRDKLEQGMARLAARQGPFKDMSAVYPTLCMARCEHHCVFCLLPESAPAGSWRFFTNAWTCWRGWWKDSTHRPALS